MENQKNFYNYIVYNDGRVYSKYVNRFLKPNKNKWGYLDYQLRIEGKAKHCKAHRLVAELFIPNPNYFKCVNHIDGNKENNKQENLEWCTIAYNNKHARDNKLNDISKSNHIRSQNVDFIKRVGRKISETQLKNNTNKGENNPNFKYRIYLNNKVISRTELSQYLKISQSYCDFLIKKSTKQPIEKFIKNNIKVINLKEDQQTIERIAQDVAYVSNRVE